MKTSIHSAKMNNITEDWKLSDIEIPLQPISTNNCLSYLESISIKLSFLNPIMYYANINHITKDWKLANQDGLKDLIMRNWYLCNRRQALVDLICHEEINAFMYRLKLKELL